MIVKFTVFTPTYQRADTLHRVYDSLCRQTLPHEEFEWLIVDDGSTDGTAELVRQWASAATFPVRYIWQENGGKHRAWNRGVMEARGLLFASIDSDDGCTPQALERLWAAWSRSPTVAEAADAVGVMARCILPSGELLGPPLAERDDVCFAEMVICDRFRWDVWHVTRADLLRAHRFPAGPAGGFVPEGTIWHAIPGRWKLIDAPLKVYFTGPGYGRPDQLTARASVLANAPGLLLYHRSILTNSWRFFIRAPVRLSHSALNLARFAVAAGEDVSAHIGAVPSRAARGLCWAMLPGAWLLGRRDLRRGRH